MKDTPTIVAMLVAVAVLGGGIAAAGPLDVDLPSYRAGGTGNVTVRAYQEPRRPGGSDTPLTDITIVMVPRSAELLDRLAKIKHGARESLARYRAAAAEVTRAQDEFVKSITAVGGEALVRQGTVDGAGAMSLADLPQGDWILLARRAVYVDKPSGTRTQHERRIYTLSRPLDGFRDVAVWMRELRIGVGSKESVDLTDRNVWFSGVEEVTRTGPGR